MTETATGKVVIDSFDAPSRTFTFLYAANLSPLVDPLAPFKDYTITVTGTSGEITPQQASATFNLKVENPCYDPSYVSITTSPFPAGPFMYTLYFGSLVSPNHIVSHSPYLVTTSPITHTLCGSITYEATFRGAVADSTTFPPVNYD